MNLANLGSNEGVHFLYLTLLLIFLVVAISSNKELSIKKSLKYLGAWSLIAIFFIGIYAYRYEFSDFKNRILGELNPSSAKVNNSGQLIVKLSKGGHFFLNVKINDLPIRFMIDTGASDIAIDVGLAQKLGINSKNLIFNKAYQTANGISWGAKTRVNNIKFANLTFKNVPVSVVNSDLGTPLLGMSFLRQFQKYEFYRDKLVLTP